MPLRPRHRDKARQAGQATMDSPMRMGCPGTQLGLNASSPLGNSITTVSYTHLTLPTIYSV